MNLDVDAVARRIGHLELELMAAYARIAEMEAILAQVRQEQPEGEDAKIIPLPPKSPTE